MQEKYMAVHVVAEVGHLSPEEREQIIDKIIKIFGCTGSEDPCVMVMCASTVVDDAETACDWLS